MYLEHFPEQYKVQQDLGLCFSVWHECFAYRNLGNVLGIKEESRIGVVQALWNYIKVNGLQDKVDRRIIRADEHLRPVRSFIPDSLFHPLSYCTADIWW